MSEKRRDNRNRILREGEYQRTDGRYRYRYIDEDGKETPFDKGDSSTFFLGSKLAIDDFENGLTGILLYEEHSFYATFPDDYIDEDYQNKKALFKVTANGLYTAPIYNNDFIKNFTSYFYNM